MPGIRTVLGGHLLVPVVVLDNPGRASSLADALVLGGLPVAEVTFRTAGAGAAIRTIADRGDVIVGAGTVTRPDQVDLAADAGARFIVSPGFSRAVVERAAERGIAMLPGGTTATEVMMALDHGLDAVKFFPAGTSGGAPAIAALAAPFAGVTFVPTGGVGLGNLADFLGLPCVAAVGGSWMVPRDLVNAGRVEEVAALVAQAVTAAACSRRAAA